MSRRRRRQLGGIKDTLAKVPKPVWYGLGALVLIALFTKRKTIGAAVSKALTEAEKKLLRTVVPEKGEEFVDLAFEIAPKYGFSPLYVLAFLAVESGFKLRPDQTGDFLPRSVTRYGPKRLAIAKQLPGVVIKDAYDDYKKITGPALVPTTTGWGFGPMQIDWVSHSDFLKTPAGRTARGQMEYAIKNVIKYSYDALKKSFPNFTHAQLLDATVAAYNAGVGGATDAIKAGRPLTSITAKSWYIPRVREYGQILGSIFGGDSHSAVV